jgi:hypothetical protein
MIAPERWPLSAALRLDGMYGCKTCRAILGY